MFQDGFPTGSRSRDGRWSYARGAARDAVEYAIWPGGSPPVFRPHLHVEAQLTVVLSGRRSFTMEAGTVTVAAGQCLYIPPCMVHQGLAGDGAPVRCANIYLPYALGDRPAVIDAGTVMNDPGALTGLIEARLDRPTAVTGPIELPCGTIAAIAAHAGVSREHFSRRFRHQAGIGPHGYRLLQRLNAARARLRGSAPIADIAADLGFADQSHLGRLFREAFGVTPRAYRLMMR